VSSEASPDALPVSVEGLEHRYGERKALQGVSFSVPCGARFALLGPNGGGKTTLFRILSTLVRPSAGCAEVFGTDVAAAPDEARRHLGVVFQSPSLDGKLSVRENLAFQGAFYGLTGADLDARIDRALERGGLKDRASDAVDTLSGGLKRRVELCKVSLHDPQLVLLDEPTTGLDPGARRDFWSWVGAMQEETGATVLFTTHILEEASGADEVLLLDAGEVVAQGTPRALCAELGGDVLRIQDDDIEGLRAEVTKRWDLEGTVVGGELRLEVEDGGRLAAEIFAALGERVRGVTVGHPSLEDVFIHRTGHGLDEKGIA
jgi:ABC-2 type transport system ATP-binding protein